MKSILSRSRAEALLRNMKGCRILVVGDLMVDRFLWGSVHRISPEAPVPVVQLSSETAVLGGAGNVARNLKSLGASVRLVGALGQDRGAADCRRLLSESDLDEQGVVDLPGRVTTVKTRVIAHQQQVVRIDQESTDPLEGDARDMLCSRAIDLMEGTAAVVVSDYDKGIITPFLLRELLAAARESNLKVSIDPKPSNYEYYKGSTAITPNLQEARAMTGVRGRTEEEVRQIGSLLLGHLECKGVLLTQGEQGMTLFQHLQEPLRIPSCAREVFDVTGAGDTVISVLTLALAAGASLVEASLLANQAAGVVVGKLGTAVVTTDELLASCMLSS